MAKESTFDIVSEVDKQEVANAVNQAFKEIQQRYDFKGTGATIEHTENTIELSANAEERVKAALDVLQSKLVRRGISLKSLDAADPVAQGKQYKISAIIKEIGRASCREREQKSVVTVTAHTQIRHKI